MTTRKTIFLITALLISVNTYAQNLVPNPSFEDRGFPATCPYNISQLILFPSGGFFEIQEIEDHCLNWMSFTHGTPDYLSACDPTLTVNVPKNIYGYQDASGGVAYAGIYTYWAGSGGDFKEYIKASITPLIPGEYYSASIHVSLADSSTFATDDLGMFFYENGPQQIDSDTVLTVIPQVSYKQHGPVTDTLNWTKLTGTIHADSAYSNIIIGGFDKPNALNLVTVNSSSPHKYAYYYIDSVIVEKCKSIRSITIDTAICAGKINIPYQLHDCTPDINNVYTVELSNYTGWFNPPVFPTKTICTYKSRISDTFRCQIPENSFYSTNYRLRITSTQPIDTFYSNPFTIYPQPVPEASNTGPACEGDGIQISVYALADSFRWTGPNGFSLTKADTIILASGLQLSGTYIVTTSISNCSASDTTEVLIKPLPEKPILSSNSPVCEGTALQINITNGTTDISYQWTGPNSFVSTDKNIVIDSVKPDIAGSYKVVADKAGCQSEDTISVTTKPVYIPKIGSNSPVYAGQELLLEIQNPKNGAAYSWTGVNNFISFAEYPIIPNVGAQHAGIYTLTATYEDCTATSILTAEIIIPKDTGRVGLYPNPNNGNFTIEGYLSEDQRVQFTITNAQGQVVYSGIIETSGKLLKEDIIMTAAASGRYYLNLWLDRNTRALPFTIVR